MTENTEQLLHEIVNVSLQILERLDIETASENDNKTETDQSTPVDNAPVELETSASFDIDALQSLMLLRQERLEQVFSNNPKEKLATYSELLSQIAELDQALVARASDVKNAFSQKIIGLKKNQKAVNSYGKY